MLSAVQQQAASSVKALILRAFFTSLWAAKELKLFVLLQAEEQLIELVLFHQEPLKVAVRYLYLLDPKMSHF